MFYAISPFGDFESFLRTTGDLTEDDIQLILKQYISIFVTFEIPRGIYTTKDILDAVYTVGDHEGTLQLENDEISMKTKLVLTCFGGTFGLLRFDKKMFFGHFQDLQHIGIINLLMKFILMDLAYILMIKFYI